MPGPTGKSGLTELPRTEFGAGGFGVQSYDLDPGFLLPITSIGQGLLVPDKIGQQVRNVSGSSIAAGKLVYVSGYDAASGLPSISLASASAQATRAQWITLATIANNASGQVGLHFSLTGQNTNAATVGDPVYLDTVAGGYTLTNPPASGVSYQTVGRVFVRSVAAGTVDFNLLAGVAEMPISRIQGQFPLIPVGNGLVVRARMVMEVPGTIGGFKCVFQDSLVASDVNFVTFDGVNLQNGAGANVITAVAPAGVNSTKATGGTAIVADTAYFLTISATPANLVVAAGDILRFRATVTGTLPNTVSEGVISVAVVPS